MFNKPVSFFKKMFAPREIKENNLGVAKKPKPLFEQTYQERIRLFESANPERKKKRVEITKLILQCPGGRHAWYESNGVVIRKPI